MSSEVNKPARGRRRLGLTLVAAGLALVASWFVVNPAGASGLDGTVSICRATGHDNQPYERVTVSIRSLVGDSSTPGSVQAGPIWYAGAATFGVAWGDIVPPLADVYPDGHNWSEGSRMWGDDCRSGTPPTSGAPATTGCTTTLAPTTSTSVVGSTTAVATSLVTTTTAAAATSTSTSTSTTTTSTTTTVVVATSSSTTSSTTTSSTTTSVAPTTSPGTTAPASSVGPPLPPSSSAAPTSVVPDSSVSPPVIPQAGSNTFALLIVGILLVLVGAVIALTSAHA